MHYPMGEHYWIFWTILHTIVHLHLGTFLERTRAGARRPTCTM